MEQPFKHNHNHWLSDSKSEELERAAETHVPVFQLQWDSTEVAFGGKRDRESDWQTTHAEMAKPGVNGILGYFVAYLTLFTFYPGLVIWLFQALGLTLYTPVLFLILIYFSWIDTCNRKESNKYMERELDRWNKRVYAIIGMSVWLEVEGLTLFSLS